MKYFWFAISVFGSVLNVSIGVWYCHNRTLVGTFHHACLNIPSARFLKNKIKFPPKTAQINVQLVKVLRNLSQNIAHQKVAGVLADRKNMDFHQFQFPLD